MPKHFWFKFEWNAWLNDRALSRCSLETQGFWIRCICLMEESSTWFLEGSAREIANLVGSGCTAVRAGRCLDELATTDAAKVVRSQGDVRLTSKRLLKQRNIREYNAQKQREHRERAGVNESSAESSKDLESSSSEEDKEFKSTHIDAGAWDWPMKPFIEAFLDYLPDRLTPSLIGFVEADVKPGDEEAWRLTIVDYQMNFNPVLSRYLPDKIGNVLGVFRKHKAQIARQQNATTRNDTNNGRQTSTGRLRDTAAIYDKYPTEAELGREP